MYRRVTNFFSVVCVLHLPKVQSLCSTECCNEMLPNLSQQNWAKLSKAKHIVEHKVEYKVEYKVERKVEHKP